MAKGMQLGLKDEENTNRQSWWRTRRRTKTENDTRKKEDQLKVYEETKQEIEKEKKI